MKVYCKLSAISFQVDTFTHKMNVEGIHPIFYVPQDRLLQRVGDWARGNLDERERKLLFLSLLKSTELVDFKCSAMPEDKTIQNSMELLHKFILWQNNSNSINMALPRYVINNDTKYLVNIISWIKLWEERVEEWKNRNLSVISRQKLALKEAALEKLIKSSFKDVESYAGRLAGWAMDAANVPNHTREYWISLFKLKGMDIYNARTVDLEEMLEHMEEHLAGFVGTIYAHAVLAHCRKLLTKNKGGLTYALGFTELEDIDEITSKTTYTIVNDEEEIETHNRNMSIQLAPEQEPKEQEYPGNRIGYIRAKAAYILAKAQQEKISEFQQKQAEKDNEDALQSISDAEDDEIDIQEDSEEEAKKFRIIQGGKE